MPGETGAPLKKCKKKMPLDHGLNGISQQAAPPKARGGADQVSVDAISGRIGRLMVMSAPLPGVERISTLPPK